MYTLDKDFRIAICSVIKWITMEECLAKLVQCAVCLETMVKPQLLSCLHSFCKACLDSIAGKRQKVVCPYCKTATPQKNIRDDFKTSELLAVLNNSKCEMTKSSIVQTVDVSCGTISGAAQAANHAANLSLVKQELVKSVAIITENNAEFQQIAVEKLRAAKPHVDRRL